MKNYKYIFSILILVLILFVSCGFKNVYAEDYGFGVDFDAEDTSSSEESGSGGKIILPPDPGNLPNVDVDSLIRTVIRILFAVGQIAFVIVLLIGGVMFITSAGNEEQAGKARKLILYAMIGIIVLFSAWAIASFIAETLNK